MASSSSSSPSPRSLVWSSIIETLAESKQADLGLLSGLIKRVPDFYTAAPQPVRERVALRYLEECASRGFVETKNGLGGTTVDIFQSTEEFLCNNLTKPIDLSEPTKSTVPISDDIRQFISQKRSALPKPSLDLLKESVSGVNAKVPSTRENGSSSSHRQGDTILDKKQDASPRQEDNNVDGEQEIIGRPRSAGGAESLHNDAPQNLPSQDAFGSDKAASGPLEENNCTTVIGDASDLEAARTDPSSDDQSKYILKRRATVAKKSVEELEEVVPDMCIPTEMTRNENNTKLRFNTDLPDDLNDCGSSQIPLSEQDECILCNEGGQLLTCSRKGCGITVHENCIQITPSSFDKEGQFYCPCCACTRAAQVYARAQKHFSLAKQSLSSFTGMQKNQNQEKGEGKQKQPVEENINGKRKGKKAESSDDATEDDDGVANLDRFPGYAPSSCETSRESGGHVKNDGKRRGKHVKSNDRDVSKDRNILYGGEGSKKQEADSAFARLDKYIYIKSGPKATPGGQEAVLINEAANETREDRVNADANKRRRATPRYSNKVAAPHRRTALPWTEEEEQALREGMQKFGATDDGRIPWSTILDYRRDVFHKTRLPSDLKDKWRNMIKKMGSSICLT